MEQPDKNWPVMGYGRHRIGERREVMADFYDFPLRNYGDRHDIEQACRVAFQTEHGYGLPEANIEKYRVFRDGFYACAIRGGECLAAAKGEK